MLCGRACSGNLSVIGSLLKSSNQAVRNWNVHLNQERLKVFKKNDDPNGLARREEKAKGCG